MKKTRQDNDVTDHIGAFYVENNIEILWPIGLGVVCDKNQIGQWYDWSNRVPTLMKTK